MNVENNTQATQIKLNSWLNILTILTFIGCFLSAYNSIRFYSKADVIIAETEKRIAVLEEKGVTGFFMDMSYNGLETLELKRENKSLLTLIEITTILMCFYGAFLMRKMQKTGFYLWLAGEYLPLIIAFIVIGSPMVHPTVIPLFIFPLVFTILYSLQFKNMTTD